MPVIRREKGKAKKGKKKEKLVQVTANGITLPTEPSEPITDIRDAVIVLYGEKKIGKSSFVSKFPEAFFFMFEPGGKGLRILKEEMPDWKKFVKWVDAVISSKLYKTLVIDTADIAYNRCLEYVCKRERMKHPSDQGYGKGWDMVNKEFEKQMTRLMQSGRGVVFISHADAKDFTKPEGDTYNKLVPTMSNGARKLLAGIADMILYYGYYDEERFITLSGSDSLEAGHRLEERFWTKDGKRRVHSIPMGSSAKEGYDNFIKAFENQQEKTGKPRGETGLEKRAPMVSTSKRR